MSDDLSDAIEQAVDDIESIGLSCALVGGLAFSALIEPRFTRDVDLAVSASSDHDAERATFALLQTGRYRLLTEGVLDHESTNRLATVRLGLMDSLIVVDLLFASSGLEQEIVEQALEIRVATERRLPVIRPGHLLATKILAGRARDLDDARAILRGISDDELAVCRRALELVETRGFHRGKDLRAAFDQLVSAADESA